MLGVLLLLCLLTPVWTGQQAYLKAKESFVRLSSESWIINEDVDSVVVAVHVTPGTADGQIILLTAVDKVTGTAKMTLSARLSNWTLVVDLVDEKDKSLVISKDVSTGSGVLKAHELNSIAFNLNKVSKTFTYRLERDKEYLAELDHLDWKDTEVFVDLGGKNNSLIGCVSLITVFIGDQQSNIHRLYEHEVDKCDGEQQCANRDCGKGICVEKEIAYCDCYGTGKSGPGCLSEAHTIEISNDNEGVEDSYIAFKPAAKVPVSRIAMQFKLKGNNEGVLMFGKYGKNDSQKIKMLIVGLKGRLDLLPTVMHFNLSTEWSFHNAELIFHEGQLQLTVDGVSQSTDFPVAPSLSSIQFGASPPANGEAEAAFSGCLKEVYVDHYDVIAMSYDHDVRVFVSKELKECSNSNQDLVIGSERLFTPDVVPEVKSGFEFEEETKEEPQVTMCENAQKDQCKHDSKCSFSNDVITCECQPGYVGSRCQFVVLPRSCAEAQKFYQKKDGPTLLDVDGSRKLTYSVALCKDGVTQVDNNMPENFVVRDIEKGHWIYRLTYRDFISPHKLAALIKNSHSCRQEVTYNCRHAPIHFNTEATYFHVATDNATVRKLSATCKNSETPFGSNCQCDGGGTTKDSGLLYNNEAAITEIMTLYVSRQNQASMTVGALKCQGFAQESSALRFTDTTTQLPIGKWDANGPVSVQFRTSVGAGSLLKVVNGEDNVLEISLANAYTINLLTPAKVVSVNSPSRLNDSNWHLLSLEWLDDEIRISVDDNHMTSKRDRPHGDLILNSDQMGLIGCFRSLVVDELAKDLDEIWQASTGSTGVQHGCDGHCSSISCHNGAECVEDFAVDAASCLCAHPDIQSGPSCEVDINTDSSVSFHGGYLTVENVTNPLQSDLVFSFRTDQSDALLFFAHDSLNNFIQIHLKDEVNMTLSVNNLQNIISCTLTAQHGKEFSDMQWYQIAVSHNEYGLQLRVDENACIIPETNTLSLTLIRTYKRWNGKENVNIPVGTNPNAVVDDQSLQMFVGGVTNYDLGTDGVHELRPIYATSLPNLLGCMRGLKIGQQIVNLRSITVQSQGKYPLLVRENCDVGCSQLSCSNGGHCSVGWSNYDPTASKTNCDCTRTSYTGPTCTDDEALILSNQLFSFNVSALLSRYMDIHLRTQTFKFAFSPVVAKVHTRQLIATVVFSDQSELEVLLNKNASINVSINGRDGRSQVLTFNGNFTDGYRHFLVARMNPLMPTSVMIDSARQDFSYSHPGHYLDLRQVVKLDLAGSLSPEYLSVHGSKKNYEGCISNLELNVAEGVKQLQFRLLDKLNDKSIMIKSQGEIVRGRCSAFKIPNTPPVLQDTIDLPEFHAVFSRQPFNIPGLPEAVDEDSGIPWLIIILSFIVAIIVLLILCFICCLLCRRRDKGEVNRSMDETYGGTELQPLYNTDRNGRPVESQFSLPAPDLDLDLPPTYAPPASNRSSMVSSSAYFTAQEDPSDDEKTITPDDYTNGELTPTLPNHFNRSAPQRLSSFKSDPTAPLTSPLFGPPKKERSPVLVTTPRAPPLVKPPPPPRTSHDA